MEMPTSPEESPDEFADNTETGQTSNMKDVISSQAKEFYQDDYSYSSHPRNNFGSLSKFIDFFYYYIDDTFMCGGIKYFTAWIPKETDSKDWKAPLTSMELREELARRIRPPCIMNYFMIKSFISLEWVKWGGKSPARQKEWLKSAMSNVAVVSALLLNVNSGFVRLNDDDTGSVVAGNVVYGFIFMIACCFALFATLMAVIFLNIINNMTNDEVAQFCMRMGPYLLIPVSSMGISMISMGCGVTYWLLKSLGINHVAVISGILVITIIPYVIYPYMYAVQSMWLCTEVTKEIRNNKYSPSQPLVLDIEEVKKKFHEYVEIMGGMEYINENCFNEYCSRIVNKNAKDEAESVHFVEMSYVTNERIKLFFKQKVEKYLLGTKI